MSSRIDYSGNDMSKTEIPWACVLAYAVFTVVIFAIVLSYADNPPIPNFSLYLLGGWGGVSALAAIVKAYLDGQRESSQKLKK